MVEALTSGFVDFAVSRYDKIFPEKARMMATDAITDLLGCMIAGANEPLAGMLASLIFNIPNGSGAPLAVSGRIASPQDSAFYNGTLAHAIDYDDVTHPAYAHPGASIVPAIFATAQFQNTTGAEALNAYIVGIEMVSRLGRTLNTSHYKNGWHASSTLGAMGAAAAAAMILRLDNNAIARTLALTASATGGLRANFGTMTKPIHVGYAARNSVLAALMAREGITASHEILEHPYGYAEVFNHHKNIDWSNLQDWGEPLEILTEYGLGLKPYPACGAAHPPIEASIRLRDQIEGGIKAIREVRIGVTEMHFEPMVYETATNGMQAKFCMNYCVAAALLDGAVNLKTFEDPEVIRINSSEIIKKINMVLDDRVKGNSEFGSVVTITTHDGQIFEENIPLAIGKPERWFSKERLHSKFQDCCSRVIDRGHANEIYSLAQNIETADTILPLVESIGRIATLSDN